MYTYIVITLWVEAKKGQLVEPCIRIYMGVSNTKKSYKTILSSFPLQKLPNFTIQTENTSTAYHIQAWEKTLNNWVTLDDLSN